VFKLSQIWLGSNWCKRHIGIDDVCVCSSRYYSWRYYPCLAEESTELVFDLDVGSRTRERMIMQYAGLIRKKLDWIKRQSNGWTWVFLKGTSLRQ